MSQSKRFEYSYKAPNGNSFSCVIEDGGDGKPATISIQILDHNEERRTEVLKECAGLTKMLEMNAQVREAMRSQQNG